MIVSKNKTLRLEAVDSLRGFSLLAIVLIHNLEHYNIFYSDDLILPGWAIMLGNILTDVISFLFAGKAYATFSLLFGFSFYIQLRNARRRGSDFRLRFAWRMLLLVGFSQLHALFYNGDILLLYAVCGLILIPASSWSNRTVLVVASILMLQPWCWGKIVYALMNPGYIDTNSDFIKYAVSAVHTGRSGDLWQTLANNIWNGQLYSNFWQVEAGRLLQTPALFLFGMWLGRKSYFEKSAASLRFWKRTFLVAAITCLPLYLLKELVPPHLDSTTIKAYYGIALPMLYNFAFMAVLVAAFMLIWFNKSNGYAVQRLIIPYGRMSLTNYIGQSILGVALYYHFGLNLWCRTGALESVGIACLIFSIQSLFSRWWLRTHKQGPLEYVWKKATWINSSTHSQTSIKSQC